MYNVTKKDDMIYNDKLSFIGATARMYVRNQVLPVREEVFHVKAVRSS